MIIHFQVLRKKILKNYCLFDIWRLPSHQQKSLSAPPNNNVYNISFKSIFYAHHICHVKINAVHTICINESGVACTYIFFHKSCKKFIIINNISS